MRYIYKILVILVIFNFIDNKINAQISNYSANIKVNSQSYIIGNNIDYVNNGDGVIDNDGGIILKGGNWLNKSNNYVFINFNQNGEVKLAGSNEQIIGGSKRTVFESLNITEGPKKLDISDNEIKNKLDLNNSGVLKLNLHKIIINNSNSDAVTADNSSYILSEQIGNDYEGDVNNDNVYGEFQWNIGSSKGSYDVPFGNSKGDKLDLTVKINTAGSPETGAMIFATYPTNSLNYPLSTSINSLGELKADDIADRYWKIYSYYDNKPSVDLTFSFSDQDILPSSNPGLLAENLLAIRYNDIQHSWIDREAGGSSKAHKVTVSGVSANDFFDWWTLTTKSNFRTPDVFTPNGDGHNDVFIPEFINGKVEPTSNVVQGIIELEGKIFNRWGNMIYQWNGENWWDGKYNGKDVAEGTYFYVITAKGTDGVNYNKKGSVALIRK